MLKTNYTAIAAVTIDGKIAAHKNHMSDWTSPEDKKFMRALLDKSDVIIVGNNTYKTAIKPLSKRNCIVFSRSESRKVGGIRKSDNLTYINPNKTDIKTIVKDCGYKKIAILGGAQTYSWCLENNLLDEIYLTIEPLIFGKGINLFDQSRLGSQAKADSKKLLNKKFKLLSIKRLNKNGTLLLKYKK